MMMVTNPFLQDIPQIAEVNSQDILDCLEEVEASLPRVNDFGDDESSEEEISELIAEGMLPKRFPDGEAVVTHDRRHVEGYDDHLVPRILGKRAFPSIE